MSHFKKRLQLLSIPAFRWYVVSCFLATFGGGLSYIAITWLALSAHNSINTVANLMICFWLPGVICGPFMGVIVDRIPYRQYLIAGSNILRAIALLIFGVVLHTTHSVNELYLLGAVLGLLFSMYLPAAGRLVREMVPDDMLLYANATIDTMYEVGNIAGMGFAGVFIAYFKAPAAIIINGILLLMSGLMMLMIRRRDLTIRNESVSSFNIVAELTSGMHYLMSKRSLLLLYALQMLLFLEYCTAPVLLAPFSKAILHADVSQFGHIEASLSVGAVLGGFLVPWLADKYGICRTSVIFIIILGVGYLWFSYNHVMIIAEFVYFLMGVAFGIWPVLITQAQQKTDIDYQGRLQSLFGSLSGLCILLIYLGVTLTSQYVSIQQWFWLEAILAAIALWLIWRLHLIMTEKQIP